MIVMTERISSRGRMIERNPDLEQPGDKWHRQQFLQMAQDHPSLIDAETVRNLSMIDDLIAYIYDCLIEGGKDPEVIFKEYGIIEEEI